MISLDRALMGAKKHRAVIIAALFLIAFCAVLLWSYSRGLSNPIKPREEAPKALESAFLRWFRGENDELLATFLLINHAENFVGRIEAVCVAYYANQREAGRYNQKLSVSLMPGETRMLNRAYIGALDPLAQTVNCRIERQE